MLHIEDMTASFGSRQVLHGVSLPPVQPGELVALIGPNAAGKSTLLRGIAGLTPAKGSVLLGNRALHGLPLAARARHLTYMPQALPQRVALTVLEAVLGALRTTATHRGLSSDAAIDRAIAVLEDVGIAALAMEPLERLSGGQRQLASLAQALVREPEVLLLDEPVSALDLHFQLRVMKLVRERVYRLGGMAIVVLHDLALAARWADRVAVLAGGRLAAAGTPAEAITADMLARIYRVQAEVHARGDGQIDVAIQDIAPVAQQGDTI